MTLIEGFRVRNYPALRDVALGKASFSDKAEKLTPLTVVIGKNGVGKSTLFDAFGFVSDCLSLGVETACDHRQRGGFERLRSKGTGDSIRFDMSKNRDLENLYARYVRGAVMQQRACLISENQLPASRGNPASLRW